MTNGESFYFVGDCKPNNFIECLVAYWLWRSVPFTLLLIGTCGNILNIIVLSGKRLRKYSTTVFLLILAITELVVLWTSLLPDTFYSITGRRFDDESLITCRLRIWFSTTAGSYSTWILVLLTVERMLLTKAPVFAREKISSRGSLIVSLVVLFIITSTNSHVVYGMKFFNFTGSDVFAMNITGNGTANESPFRCFFVSQQYEYFYRNYWSVYFLIVYNIVPAAIIITGNVSIAVVLLKGMFGLTPRVHAEVNPTVEKRKWSSAKLLFTLSTFYVLTTTPWSIYWIKRGGISFQEKMDGKSLARWQLATAIVNIFLWSNFTFNFFFYFVRGALFKKEWNRLVDKLRTSCQREVQ